jgi:hypothetical protein
MTRFDIDTYTYDEGDTVWLINKLVQVAECDEGVEWFSWDTDETFETIECYTEAEAKAELERLKGSDQ